jgi:hypothetical protein
MPAWVRQVGRLVTHDKQGNKYQIGIISWGEVSAGTPSIAARVLRKSYSFCSALIKRNRSPACR